MLLGDNTNHLLLTLLGCHIAGQQSGNQAVPEERDVLGDVLLFVTHG
jgi:hypothetical protein